MDKTDGSVSSVPTHHKSCLSPVACFEIANDVTGYLLESSRDSGSFPNVLEGFALEELVYFYLFGILPASVAIHVVYPHGLFMVPWHLDSALVLRVCAVIAKFDLVHHSCQCLGIVNEPFAILPTWGA